MLLTLNQLIQPVISVSVPLQGCPPHIVPSGDVLIHRLRLTPRFLSPKPTEGTALVAAPSLGNIVLLVERVDTQHCSAAVSRLFRNSSDMKLLNCMDTMFLNKMSRSGHI
jgi:hypothetical protein